MKYLFILIIFKFILFQNTLLGQNLKPGFSKEEPSPPCLISASPNRYALARATLRTNTACHAAIAFLIAL
jgi:hypothetical protein